MLTKSDIFKTKGYINGDWVDADSGAVYAVTNPATGETIAEAPDMGAAQTRHAIEAAAAAWPAWRDKTARERGAILGKWNALILQHADELAHIMTSECGKPLAEARGEVVYGAGFVAWFAEEAKRVYGDVIPTVNGDRRLLTIKQPIGVCAAITPWNFPLGMITRKCAPALAVGCPVVVKPAEDTPFTALALAELGARAGIPAGVFNIVTAAHGAEVGGEMCANPLVRKMSFTGSTAVGKLLMRQSADTVKKVSMELGGNAPFIVFDDADLKAAVAGAMASKYRNTGQTCVCANRFIVQEGIYDAFTKELAQAVDGLVVGNGMDPGVTQGPLINRQGLEKARAHVSDALDKGATLIAGGKPHALGGTYFEPTILADVTTEMVVAREETFGPVAPLFRFLEEAEAVAMANDTEFGLAAYCYTRDVGRAWRMGEALEYGMVGLNEGLISTEVAPFGGIKESGLGREGAHQGIEEYVETKYLCFGGV